MPPEMNKVNDDVTRTPLITEGRQQHLFRKDAVSISLQHNTISLQSAIARLWQQTSSVVVNTYNNRAALI